MLPGPRLPPAGSCEGPAPPGRDAMFPPPGCEGRGLLIPGEGLKDGRVAAAAHRSGGTCSAAGVAAAGPGTAAAAARAGAAASASTASAASTATTASPAAAGKEVGHMTRRQRQHNRGGTEQENRISLHDSSPNFDVISMSGSCDRIVSHFVGSGGRRTAIVVKLGCNSSPTIRSADS